MLIRRWLPTERPEPGQSGQDALDRVVLFHAREAHVEALELVGKAAMIDAQAVEDGGVEVVDVYGILDHVVAEIIGLAVHEPLLDSAAGKPDGEALGMVVAAIVVLGQ